MVKLAVLINTDDRIIRKVIDKKVFGTKYQIKKEKRRKKNTKNIKIGNMNSSSTFIIMTNQ